MKKNKIGMAMICVLLVGAMVCNLAGCSNEVRASDLMEGITANAVTGLEDLSAQNPKAADFAVRLLQACEKSGENTLLSPLSVLCALSMTANGAEGETREQMEAVLGMSVEELNVYLHSYVQSLPQWDKYKLSLANSIWFTEKENFTVNPEFLQTNADYYGAAAYKAPFNKQTCKDINNWVKENTDGMIPEILDEIPEDAVMYLVNALAFEAEWAEIYEKNVVREGEFTKENGEKQNGEFMYSTEWVYLEDENAVGFMKYYSGEKYAFVALLPNEGMSVSEYVAALDGEALHEMLSRPEYTTVYASIPKFETEFELELSHTLKEMGMERAFDVDDAEFGGLGTVEDGNILISRVLHKTFISVGERGTKAGAATVVEMTNGTAMPSEPKTVHLDRPFVYMLIDCENQIPFFIGTMMELG